MGKEIKMPQAKPQTKAKTTYTLEVPLHYKYFDRIAVEVTALKHGTATINVYFARDTKPKPVIINVGSCNIKAGQVLNIDKVKLLAEINPDPASKQVKEREP